MSYRSIKRSAGTIIVGVILCLLIIALPLASCTPKQMIGEILICSNIDNEAFEPIDIGDEYSIDSEQIFAVVKVSGMRGSDIWRFIWRNADTNEIIADSTNTYSTDKSSFIEGYLPNKLLPAVNASIIAEPGNYTVSYYHNGNLARTAEFKIKKPETSILEVGFYKNIDTEGRPEQKNDIFSQKDAIYMGLEVDYRIKGDNYKVKWFADEKSLGEEELIIGESHYMPGHIIFQLINENQKPFPVGHYKVHIFYADRMMGEYFFEVAAEEFTEDIFTGGTSLHNEDFGFTVIYPDGWSLVEENIEAGLKTKFAPEDGIRQIIINMWVLKEDYSPAVDGYSSFADELLIEQTEQEDEGSIEKIENEKIVEDIEVFEIRYDKKYEADAGWSMTFSIFKKNNMLFLFTRLTDTVYIDYAEKVVDTMIKNISFTE